MIDPQQRRRILVIDDNDAIHDDFRKTLAQSSPVAGLAAAASMIFGTANIAAEPCEDDFEIDSALQGEQGFRMVQEAVANGRAYAMAFVDMRMPPGWDGVETIQHLWSVDPDLQVVICTAHTDYSWEQIVHALGKTDRLLILKKPFDPMEVCQLATSLCEKWKLKRQAGIKHEELERMVQERTTSLRRMAITDQLTGLPNRAGLQEYLTRAVARTAGSATPAFAVLFMDFDRFKLVNDSLGHEAGDQLLVLLSRRLCELLRVDVNALLGGGARCSAGSPLESIAARLGGDEFVVVPQGIRSLAEAEALAQRIVAAMAAPFEIKGQLVHCTASIGIALGDGSQRGEDILREADTAMYAAKSRGRNGYSSFTPEMHKSVVSRLTLENDLQQALERGELFLEYQPIIALSDALLEGFEALLRWKHPTRGLISPADFIPIAEETGLIVPIGRWVLDEALRQLRQWHMRAPRAAELAISVNCSKRQLLDPRFPAQVREALHRHGVAPAHLNLEITESAVFEHQEQTLKTINELKAAGICLHMDDFGTGYSSLSYLHLLQLHVLKIDRSFITNVSMRRDYASVVNAIIQLAQNLGMKVIAEGVETADHAAMLCALDCHAGQGYFFSRPVPADKAFAFITHSESIGAHAWLQPKAVAR
jgi:predicted signal transduction protein with EAL and GGDEF domain